MTALRRYWLTQQVLGHPKCLRTSGSRVKRRGNFSQPATISPRGPRSDSGSTSRRTVMQRTQKEKPTFARRQQDLLTARYDLANRPAQGVTMSRGKAVQDVCASSCPRT